MDFLLQDLLILLQKQLEIDMIFSNIFHDLQAERKKETRPSCAEAGRHLGHRGAVLSPSHSFHLSFHFIIFYIIVCDFLISI